MTRVQVLTKYTPEVAQRVQELLIALSRSGKDKGEIPEQWFQDIIASPNHDLLLAYSEEADDRDSENSKNDFSEQLSGKIIGMASLSLVMGAGIGKNIYLEDFVTDPEARGQGVGTALWEAMLEWGREKGARRMEFTCGQGREAAQEFYRRRGAEIYETNFFRIDL